MDHACHRQQDQQRNHGYADHRPDLDATMFLGISRTREDADVPERFVATQTIGDESDHHAEPGGAEAEGPAHSLAEDTRSEEHTSELQSLAYLVCRLLLEKKKKTN